MTSSDHYRRLERMLAGAPITQLTQVRMSVSEGRAELTLPVQKRFFHAAGALHGALYFMALDNAAFFAANSLVSDAFVLTSNFNLYLLRPVSTGEIRAVGTVVAKAGKQIIAESIAYDDRQREIARGTGTFVPSRTKLTEDIGYL